MMWTNLEAPPLPPNISFSFRDVECQNVRTGNSNSPEPSKK